MSYRLYTSYYDEPNIARRKELELCLQINQMSFDDVIVFSEKVEKPKWFEGEWVLHSRPKFRELWQHFQDGEVNMNVIANCDVFFLPKDLSMADHAVTYECETGRRVLCLTRHEMQGTKFLMSVWNVGYSQDAWVFVGKPELPKGVGEFWFGVPGCDNRFSWELNSAGFEVTNPSMSIASYHVHASARRTETNKESHRVPPPYLYIEPHGIFDPVVRTEALTMEKRRETFARKRARTGR